MDFINTCYETTAQLRSLALYSHLLPVLVAIVLSVFIYRFAENRISAKLFVLFVFLLSIWLTADLIAWYSNNYFLVAASWSILDFVNILFYLVLLFFFYIQSTQDYKRMKWLGITMVFLSIVPLLLTMTGLSVGEFDETNCEMASSTILANYKLVLDIVCIFSIFIIGIISSIYYRQNRKQKNQILVLTLSAVVFLIIFSGSDFLATLTSIYEINLYALFALPIFLMILTFNIIEQGTFRLRGDSFAFAKLLFVIFIFVAIFNLILANDVYDFIITSVSSVVTSGFGILLLRSASRESRQRKQIEGLAVNLEKANNRLKELDKQKSEFVSIASHQLRSPLTAIRGYVSMLQEGSYGAITTKQAEPLIRVQESAKFMAISIDDFLNVSRIESGNMKYELKDISLPEHTSSVVEDLRSDAIKRGLLLLYRSDIKSRGIINADFGKMQQILHNLINNALKYTPKGTVTVYVHDNLAAKRIYVEIIDTGIGMTKETIYKLFEKFSRAKVASSANIMGTGLGLFVAREMARAMKGDVTAHSDGVGKGSRFVLTLPLQN